MCCSGWLPRALVVCLLGAALAGCSLVQGRRPEVPLGNPLFVPVLNADFAWDQIVDVVDDDFEIDREHRVRRVSEGWTEGRIDTFPIPAATMLEPWHRDSVTTHDRLEATLQSIRRRCEVKVIPVEGGFLVDLAVYNELEDTRPEFSPTESATFRSDQSLQRMQLEPNVWADRASLGWIPMGRDCNLEQRMLLKIADRLQVPGGGGPMPSQHMLMH